MAEGAPPDTDSDQFAAEVLNDVRTSVLGVLGKEEAEAWFAPLFDGLASVVSDLTNDAEQADPPPAPVACAAGCAYCCHLYDVGATPFEALRVADFVAETFTPDQRAALLDRLARTAALKRDHPRERWATARFPCAFLVDGLCAVHAARPFACRGYNSLDVDRCRAFHGNTETRTEVPEFTAQRRIAELVRDGARLAAAERGLVGDVVELAPAVRIALTTPGVRRRWLAGEPVFEDAVCTLDEDGWG